MGNAAVLIGVGMAVVFAALVILMVAIMVINRLAPAKGGKAEGPALLETIEVDKSERARVAALAVAVARAMEGETQCDPRQGSAGAAGLAGEPSRWAAAGREEAMRARGKAGRRWGRRSD